VALAGRQPGLAVDMAPVTPTHLRKDPLHFITCGDVDDGKSTLVERLRREAGVLVADLSGHERHTRNLATDASSADCALLLVDVRKGLATQTRRHSAIVSLLGPRQIVLVVNKLDLVAYAEKPFRDVAEAYRTFALRLGLGLGLEDVTCIPVSALRGDNVVAHSEHMPWYEGPTVLDHLEAVQTGITRGEGIAGQDQPPQTGDKFEATIVWLAGEPMLQGRTYVMRIGAATAVATVAPLKFKLNVDSLEHLRADQLELNDIGVCELELDRTIAFDPYSESRAVAGLVLIDRITKETVGAGVLNFELRRSQNVRWQAIDVDKSAHARLKGQRPCVLWLTGLSAAGKSTIANAVERQLHTLGRHTYLLDGDNIRHGLNKDLGFTDADRVENIRRVAEVARLMVDAGLIVITAFISPFAAERRMARDLFGAHEFIEIFVDTPLEVAERRDPKRLYAKARRGELANFTGIDSPYEAPEAPELRIRTTELTSEQAAELILALLRERGMLASR
jgi:adenylyl-sulfate kinase